MRTRLLPLAALVAVFATGCMSPYLKRAPNTPEPSPSPALVTGFQVRVDSGNQEKSLLDAAVDAAQNSQLEEFGKQATKLLGEVLGTHGFTVAYDQQRTFKLDAMQLAEEALDPNFTDVAAAEKAGPAANVQFFIAN